MMRSHHENLFTRAYIECMLWSSTDENGEPLDKHHALYDLAPETLRTIETDCDVFHDANAALIEDDLTKAGQDFWLTRNHHGSGFWDGDWRDGEALTKAAHMFGECEPYISNDGLVYLA